MTSDSESPRPLRVLAVDDDESLRRAYLRMARGRLHVRVVEGAEAALQVLEADRTFDLILCDLQMPGMSGMELHQVVRGRWPGLENRFVFASGGAVSPEAAGFMVRMKERCLEKPFAVEELLAIAREMGLP